MKKYIKVLLIFFCLNGYQNIAAMEVEPSQEIDYLALRLEEIDYRALLLEGIKEDNETKIRDAVNKYGTKIFDHKFLLREEPFVKAEGILSLDNHVHKYCALHLAIRFGNQHMVKTILQLGANANQGVTEESYTYNPLSLALMAQPVNENILKMLLEHGADPLKKDATGKSPHELAKEKGISFSLAHYRTKSAAFRKKKQ